MSCLLLAGCISPAVYADEAKKPSDYEKHIEIWGDDVPGNSMESKLSHMDIDTETNYGDIASEFSKVIVGGDYKDAERVIDSMTYYAEIQPGYESERFDDKPYLIPYPADGRSVVLSKTPEKTEVSEDKASDNEINEDEVSENGTSGMTSHVGKISGNSVSKDTITSSKSGKKSSSGNKAKKEKILKSYRSGKGKSKKKDSASRNEVSKNLVSENKIQTETVSGGAPAVIILSGGAYTYKSMDGSDFESRDIAVALNSSGISAFVLHYRTNPYEYPYPWLDLQRAVRHLRYYASDYGIDPDKISLLGCSAGGNLACTFINEIRGRDLLPEGYIKDDVDLVSDEVSTAALIYPVTTFNYNISMLFAAFPADQVRDGDSRNSLLQQMNLSANFNSSDIPQLVCYGTADRLVNHAGTLEYVSAAEGAGTDIKSYALEGLDHAFRCDNYIEGYVDWLREKGQ